jgi:hypothetical protein
MIGSERVGYEERLARALARAQVALAAATPAVALTVRDVAAILGTTTQTVNSWIRNGFPTARPPIWHDGAWTTGATSAARSICAPWIRPRSARFSGRGFSSYSFASRLVSRMPLRTSPNRSALPHSSVTRRGTDKTAPDAHVTGAQRVAAFTTGYNSGSPLSAPSGDRSRKA